MFGASIDDKKLEPRRKVGMIAPFVVVVEPAFEVFPRDLVGVVAHGGGLECVKEALDDGLLGSL